VCVHGVLHCAHACVRWDPGGGGRAGACGAAGLGGLYRLRGSKRPDAPRRRFKPPRSTAPTWTSAATCGRASPARRAAGGATGRSPGWRRCSARRCRWLRLPTKCTPTCRWGPPGAAAGRPARGGGAAGMAYLEWHALSAPRAPACEDGGDARVCAARVGAFGGVCLAGLARKGRPARRGAPSGRAARGNQRGSRPPGPSPATNLPPPSPTPRSLARPAASTPPTSSTLGRRWCARRCEGRAGGRWFGGRRLGLGLEGVERVEGLRGLLGYGGVVRARVERLPEPRPPRRPPDPKPPRDPPDRDRRRACSS
jgi:hypothetical protein